MLAGDLILPVAQLIDRTLEQLATRLDRDLLDALDPARSPLRAGNLTRRDDA